MDERAAEIKFFGEPAFLTDFASELATTSGVEVSTIREEPDPSNLALDLGTVASVVSLIQFALLDRALVPTLWRTLSHHRPKEVVLKTPFKTTRIEWTNDMTEADVRSIVTNLLRDELSSRPGR